MNKPVIVTPGHHKPSEDWIKSIPEEIPVIFVVDGPRGLFEIKRSNFKLYYYEDQRELLGDLDLDWSQFKHSASIKNFGHWLAWKEGYDPIISLDYDCIIDKDFVKKHIEVLQSKPPSVESPTGWVNPLMQIGVWPRGFPYSKRKVVYHRIREIEGEVKLNMGLWDNLLDLNGMDRVSIDSPKSCGFEGPNLAVIGNIPFCGMNFAFRRELAPALLMLPNFKIKNLIIKRHDDTWGGYIIKKFMDKRGDLFTYGKPIVFHDSDVDIEKDIQNEAGTIAFSETFFKFIDEIFERIKPKSYERMWRDFSRLFERKARGTVFEPLTNSIIWWKELFQIR